MHIYIILMDYHQKQQELSTYNKKEFEIYDHILKEAGETRDIHRTIDDTIDKQGKVINKLDRATERNTETMKITGTKLDDIVERQSYGCLYITIAVEVLLMLIMVVYL